MEKSEPALRRNSKDVDRDYAMLIDGAWAAALSGETFACVDKKRICLFSEP